MVHHPILCWQIDLRKESTIKFIAPSPYPVITFGPFTSPSAVLVSLSHATGNLLDNPGIHFFKCSIFIYMFFMIP